MNTHKSIGQAGGAHQELECEKRGAHPDRRLERARVIRHSAALAGALLAIALVTAGCGKHTLDSTTSAHVGSDPQSSNVPGEPAVLASASGGESTADTSGKQPEAAGQNSPEALPPAVDAAVVDSVVTPGSVVEISALASTDVVDMGLSDGIGKEQPFSYDSTMNVWRALYRVPIRNSKDRLGLAVTATNESGHWRRVWVFLNLQQP